MYHFDMTLKIYRSPSRSILCFEDERTYEEISTDEANAIIHSENVIVVNRETLYNAYRDLACFGYKRREKNESDET